ncbi:tyrosine 3-monooxygenase isoform X1 [Macrobrachium rosenbergii]|uniref:tyrosine 3-monooxygenase isoform X1 n=1 Tax=Macrobrachium rosenbergii TaxID=79674 RepID=UPI0034D615E9
MKAAEMNRERFAINKSYSIENGYPARRRSLVVDAKFETTINKQKQQSWLEEAQRLSCDGELSEEEVFLVQSPCEPDQSQQVALVVGLIDGVGALPRIIKTIENFKGTVLHVETRSCPRKGVAFDVLLKLDILREPLLNLLKSLRQGSAIASVKLLSEHHSSIKEPWFPKHISELDMCNHLMTKFEPDLDMDHPGFSDPEYRARRKEIADIAFTYRHGESIPRIKYREEEIETWKAVFIELEKLIPTHACKEYRLVWEALKNDCGYAADNIPQLQDVSNFMKRRTGFTLRPAAGLLTARDFLASLAFRVFQCTQYIRHHSSPHHSPEPDAIHELLGHAPLLAEPSFAQFSQELGLASLGASDEEIEKFATMYWFTVEFGLCREGDEIRAWGAGLLSSFGELQHSLSDKPEKRDFDPATTSVQPYQDQDYQDVYFVAQNLEDAQEKFRRWTVQTLSRPYEVRYEPFSQTVQILDSVDKMESLGAALKTEVMRLNNAIVKMKF